MYEFMGAVAARSVLVEGEFSQASALSACVGLLLMQTVAYFTKEDVEVYAFVLAKYVGGWFIACYLLGAVVALMSGLRFTPDTNARTRAWANGPRLPAVFMATREIAALLVALFLPLNERTHDIIRYGIGYDVFAGVVGALFVVLTGVYAYLGSRPMMAAPVSATAAPKKKKTE
ncbi:hypothetical protein BC831DRAFT_494454 [Entophlyctis helioformis]|nr:hypothetical protein BC831DRAFT_494454 [Entophlyctis helioformis]